LGAAVRDVAFALSHERRKYQKGADFSSSLLLFRNQCAQQNKKNILKTIASSKTAWGCVICYTFSLVQKKSKYYNASLLLLITP
jgi:hypothetical protein